MQHFLSADAARRCFVRVLGRLEEAPCAAPRPAEVTPTPKTTNRDRPWTQRSTPTSIEVHVSKPTCGCGGTTRRFGEGRPQGGRSSAAVVAGSPSPLPRTFGPPFHPTGNSPMQGTIHTTLPSRAEGRRSTTNGWRRGWGGGGGGQHAPRTTRRSHRPAAPKHDAHLHETFIPVWAQAGTDQLPLVVALGQAVAGRPQPGSAAASLGNWEGPSSKQTRPNHQE